jgi:hypothetical protein
VVLGTAAVWSRGRRASGSFFEKKEPKKLLLLRALATAGPPTVISKDMVTPGGAFF